MRRHAALLAATLTLPLTACEGTEKTDEPRVYATRTLAQAEWDLAPADSRRSWCRVWKKDGEAGVQQIPRTGPAAEDEQFPDDLITVLKENC